MLSYVSLRTIVVAATLSDATLVATIIGGVKISTPGLSKMMQNKKKGKKQKKKGKGKGR